MKLQKIDGCEFLIVIPFCAKDGELMAKNIAYLRKLMAGVTTPFHALLSFDEQTPRHTAQIIKEEASYIFKEVHDFIYPPPPNNSWPVAPNHAFQNAARYIPLRFSCPWFWYESDAVALRPDWLEAIWNEYKNAKKPFMGHVVAGMGHLNGVAVYPNDVARYSISAMLANKSAWDVAMTIDIKGQVHVANHLFQHIWTVEKVDEMTQQSMPVHITFPDWKSVEDAVDFRCALMHRCKDLTLIDRITEHHWGNATEKFVPQLPKIEVETPKEAVVKDEEIKKISCEIFIVSYWKDLPWLKFCLKALDKYVSGFAGTTVLVPEQKAEVFLSLKSKHKINLKTFKEVEGKGMVHHMAQKCSADLIVPKDRTHVLHLDSDCIFHTPTTPANYFGDGKPHYLIRSVDSLKNADGVWSDNIQWVNKAEKVLGFKVKWYTMCRHPTLYPVDLYKPLREHIEKNVKQPFLEYVLSGKNTFPQDFPEFPVMGAYAFEFHRNRFFWMDCSNGIHPGDRQKTYWSHGGLKQKLENGKTAEQEIKEFLI